jgi:hypothetical protein
MNQIENPIVISLKEFNEKCKALGLEPFPIAEFRFNAVDKLHFELSVKNIQNQLLDWSIKQTFKR